MYGHCDEEGNPCVPDGDTYKESAYKGLYLSVWTILFSTCIVKDVFNHIAISQSHYSNQLTRLSQGQQPMQSLTNLEGFLKNLQ